MPATPSNYEKHQAKEVQKATIAMIQNPAPSSAVMKWLPGPPGVAPVGGVSSRVLTETTQTSPRGSWNKPYTFEQWLRTYYKATTPANMRDAETQELIKADDRYDYGSTAFWSPEHGAEVQLEGLLRSYSIYSLLPKTTFMQESNSFRYVSADASAAGTASWLADEGAMFASDTGMPTLVEVEGLWPAVFAVQWEDTKVMTELEKTWKGHQITAPFLRQYFNNFYLDRIDRQLAGVQISSTVHGVDSPATDGSSHAEIECLDRMISNQTESGGTTHVSAATDGDIFWGKTNVTGTDTAIFDRSAVTTSDANLILPTDDGGAAGTNQAYNILDQLDYIMAQNLIYAPSDKRNYIGLCSPLALNKIQNEIDPKQRFLDLTMDVTQTINGVTTRPGALGGKFSVAALALAGVKVPMFTSPYLAGQDGKGWKNSVYTTAGVGNIYLINTDCMEIRHLFPITAQDYPNYGDWILGERHVIFSAMQLLCRNFHACGALKYIAT